MIANKRGILAVVGCSVAIFWPGALIFGYPGVMGPYWQEMFGVGQGAVNNTMFFLLTALGFFMFLVGQWQEKYGTRMMISIGALACSLNMLILACTSSLYWLYLWAFINGAACSFIYIPGLTSVQRWFVNRRGLVSGIVSLVFGMSAAVMAPIFSKMLHSTGYVPMNFAIAAISLLIGITAAQFTETPERIKIAFEAVSGGGASATSAAIQPPQPVEKSLTVKEALKTRDFWFLWLTWAFQGAAGIAMVNLSVIFGLFRGFSMESSVIILTAFNTMSGLSRILTGYISDIAGRSLTMSITFLAAGGAYFALAYSKSPAACAVFAGIIGFAFGTLFAVSAPLTSDCFGLKHFGAIFGLIFTAYGFISGAIGPSLSGYILDLTGENYIIVFTYLGIFSLISSLFVKLVKAPLKT